MNTEPDISVVVPFFNEEGSLRELHSHLTQVLAARDKPYEILMVNDGSTDGGGAVVEELATADPHVGLIEFRRNFGKAAALDAGFKRARGRIIITMDADLQDDPKEIPRFIEKLDEGFDVVSGWKQVRNDPVDKTLPSKIFNYVVAKVSGLKLRDVNCGFKAYRREAVEHLTLYGEMHRFVPVLVHWQGFRVGEMPVEHHSRKHGKSKYGVERLVKGFFDLMTVLLTTRFLTRPLHLFGGLGLLLTAAGFAVLAYLAVMWFAGQGPIGTRPLLFLGLLLCVVGVQCISTGLLGELIVKRFHMERPSYVIRHFHAPGAPLPRNDAGGGHDQLRKVSDQEPHDAPGDRAVP